MAGTTFKKDSKEFQWFTDFWKIVQKFWSPEKDNPEYWEELLAFAGAMCKKYASDDKLRHFSLKMMIALANFLDEEARGEVTEK